MSKFQVSVNGNVSTEIDSKDVEQLDLQQIADNHFHLLKDFKSYKTQIVQSDYNQRTYQVKVNNNLYNMSISDDLDVLIKDMGFEIGSAKHVNDLKAPMPGLILDINVSVGQEVKEDDSLLILEAMKMENVLTSPRDGIIKSIAVSQGDAVDKNQLLLEFE
ncbi:acetyl-CoA carboxylase biotin carboxyl carrier protein subunit [Mangrovimonas spongiae]|uniref:Acetyl-CoA carboxylase biotin carboxyl carrier protein subunit n=1 Tax=Mangrovimonas spongiae TaxID=2494697 RepID=A0A3R9MTE9_9FLAO|nr:acetyl-CoA carboxylase biotin carboxyl carrier protein subunit [Mangrovimonas spongiae]RSK40319.1 acetyl-CoA carboxylase biotin carboxyl carrier protein subunit [Mangrovimonas spongiae]